VNEESPLAERHTGSFVINPINPMNPNNSTNPMNPTNPTNSINLSREMRPAL
jgi:hypothetical protein